MSQMNPVVSPGLGQRSPSTDPDRSPILASLKLTTHSGQGVGQRVLPNFFQVAAFWMPLDVLVLTRYINRGLGTHLTTTEEDRISRKSSITRPRSELEYILYQETTIPLRVTEPC